jgi:methylenetetrahydrofolate--tRNA-(uracil-5-)-methyltransferase
MRDSGLPAAVHVIGGGLAGSEAAWQAASAGVPAVIHEMRPVRGTAVHKTEGLAELVCSNSFRGDKLDNAVGLLKEEMRRLGSVVMRAAEVARVPAGAALAVDRERFSEEVTRLVSSHPLITIVREEVPRIPSGLDGPLIIATGPLTSDSLSADIAALVGGDHLYFYDAISPIVLAETIDMSRVFRASRWGRGSGGGQAGVRPAFALRATAGKPGSDPVAPATRGQTGVRPGSDPVAAVTRGQTGVRPGSDPVAGEPQSGGPACGVDDGEGLALRSPEGEGGDYLNCPFTAEEYARFYEALMAAEKAPLKEMDDPKFFEGCLPIEVMAARGVDTLRFGPMKPVGLPDPRTGREAYAVVQLRQDNLAGDHYSLVGFQTQMKWGEQARVLRLIPGLEHAEFVRFGMIHRNTYINGPTVLRDTWQVRGRDDLFFAGQISGVEGYVESAASGLIAGRNAAALVLGEPLRVPPRTTAIGALAYYVSHAEPKHYQPTNITFGIMEPLPPGKKRRKADRKLAQSERALADLDAWMEKKELSTTEERR